MAAVGCPRDSENRPAVEGKLPGGAATGRNDEHLARGHAEAADEGDLPAVGRHRGQAIGVRPRRCELAALAGLDVAAVEGIGREEERRVEVDVAEASEAGRYARRHAHRETRFDHAADHSIEAVLLRLTTPAAIFLLMLLVIFAFSTARGRKTLRALDPLFALIVVAVLALPYAVWLMRAETLVLPFAQGETISLRSRAGGIRGESKKESPNLNPVCRIAAKKAHLNHSTHGDRWSRFMSGAEQRDYFARRAANVRELAATANDPEIRAVLQGMAASYGQLVEEADRAGHRDARLLGL